MSDFSKLNGFNVKDKKARAMFDYLHTIFAEDILQNGDFNLENDKYTSWLISDSNGDEIIPSKVDNGISFVSAFIDQEIEPLKTYSNVTLVIDYLYISSPVDEERSLSFTFGGSKETEGVLAGSTYNHETTHKFKTNTEYTNVIITMSCDGEKPTDTNYKFRIKSELVEGDASATIKGLKLYCYDNLSTARFKGETFEEERRYTGDMG